VDARAADAVSNGDIVLLLIMVGAFIVGFVWGTARTLIFLGGWFVIFLLAMHARPPLAGFLQNQWTQYTPVYNDMAAMGILYTIGLVALVALVWLGGRNTGISERAPDVDRLVGGLAGVACAVLVVAGLMVTLAVFYGHDAAIAATGGPEWTASLYRGLVESQIGGAIHRSLIPALGSVLNPILPIGMAEAFGQT
jgi:hypothetical protein